MKVVIQRVTQGCVKGYENDKFLPETCISLYLLKISVKEELISSIGRGLVVLVGVQENDNENDMNFIIRKILNIKFFEDESGKKWSKNVMDKQYEVLCISQFTLCYSMKGNKLDFHHAMKPDNAIKFYENFLDSLKKQYKPEMIKSGKFGAYCQVELSNDGPVTINLESKTSTKAEVEDCS